ncbi:hypothetical protein Aduo_000819 [Ancylostoma duodenale]
MNQLYLLLAFAISIQWSFASLEDEHHEAPVVAEVPAVAHVPSVKHVPAVAHIPTVKHVPAVAHIPTVKHVPTVAHVPVLAAAAPVHEHHRHSVEVVHHDSVHTETEHGGHEDEASPYKKRKLASKSHKKRKLATKKASRKHRKHGKRRH